MHIDGSRHQWFQDERWYDLIVIIDDATSEIYYAQVVEEESTGTVMAGLREVIERKGVFWALYSDRGSHFWLTRGVFLLVGRPLEMTPRFALSHLSTAMVTVLFLGQPWSDRRLAAASRKYFVRSSTFVLAPSENHPCQFHRSKSLL
ncbi:MAG: hypothetical protein ACRD20_13765 [Terriglobales bacterium]